METEDFLKKRIARNWLWLVLIGLAAVGTFFVGQRVFFANADCPILQNTVLAVATVAAWLVLSVRAIVARNITPFSQIVRAVMVAVIGLLVSTVVGATLPQMPQLKAQFCSSCEQNIDTAQDMIQTALDEKESNKRLEILHTAGIYAERAQSTCGGQSKSAAARVAALVPKHEANDHLNAKPPSCAKAYPSLMTALKIARENNLDFVGEIEQMEKRYEALCIPIPTPVPPTRTPTLVPPTPTRTPTPFRTPVIVPDKVCAVPTYTPAAVKLLTAGFRQGTPKPVPVGEFFREEFLIDYEFKGDEKVCLASTPDGKGPLRVDDRLYFEVLVGENVMGIWDHDFYSESAHGTAAPGIAPFGSQDVSITFPPGRYKVRLVLRDLHAQYYSSTAIYLVIWEQR